jgi:shikimate dehydrogenase
MTDLLRALPPLPLHRTIAAVEKIGLGLFGGTLSASLSPTLQTSFASQLGIEVEYHRLPSSSDDFERTLEASRGLSLWGANVTNPHKLSAWALCQRCTPLADRVGAVNTLRWNARGELEGHNTDVYGLAEGLRQALESQGVDRALIKEVVVIGAGGVTRGTLEGLSMISNRQSTDSSHLDPFAQWGFDRVSIYARNEVMSEALCRRFEDRLPLHSDPIESVATRLWRGDELLILCIPPLDQLTFSALFGPFVGARQGPALCYDLNYGSRAVVSRDWAQSVGLLWSDGLGMLIAQGVASFEWWTGYRCSIDEALKLLLRAQQS